MAHPPAARGARPASAIWVVRDVAYATHIVPDRYLCASAGRSLTRAEWARYVPPGLAYQQLCP